MIPQGRSLRNAVWVAATVMSLCPFSAQLEPAQTPGADAPKGIETASTPDGDAGKSPRAVEATIRAVKKNEKLMVLSVGGDRGVKRGDLFTVSRGSTAIGQIEVYPALAGAQVVSTEPGREIQPGDRASLVAPANPGQNREKGPAPTAAEDLSTLEGASRRWLSRIGTVVPLDSAASPMLVAGEKGIETLAQELKADDPKRRRSAAEALSKLALLKVRLSAQLSTVRAAQPLLTVLVPGLSDKDADVRLRVVRAMGEIIEQFEPLMAQGAVPLLKLMTRDEDARVREAATKAIERIEQVPSPRRE